MASKQYITIPSGRKIGLGQYVRAWKALKDMHPETRVDNWNWYPTPAAEIMRDMCDGMFDRINRHVPGYENGRKWSYEYQLELIRLRPFLDNPRLVMHQVHHILDKRIKNTLKHRTRTHG